MKFTVFILSAFFGVGILSAQRDSVIVLNEVILSDSKLSQFAEGRKLTILKDSVLQVNKGMLTDNLKFTTPIYFRQNGYGMVSSASFRGTSAQQTAVVWNGININSQLTGQTDFNTVMAQNYDAIQIRSGGGSTQYGTGAVGGSIHLNDQLHFENEFENDLRIGYGSFETRNLHYKSKWGTGKTAYSIGLGHFGSENNFKYLGTNQRNENGAFTNQNLDFAFGQLLSDTHIIKFFHNTFLGNRDFSGTLTAPSNDTYRDLNTRSLLELTNFKKKYVQRVKMAYLSERFRYYANKESDAFSFGKSGSFLLNYDYLYRFKKWKFNGIIEANNVKAEGSSILAERRNRVGAIVLISHAPSEKLVYELDLRQDWVNDFNSPVVFSTDFKYQASEKYALKFNASRNYRIPTFNDLYWDGPGATGNLDLTPETALQAEIGQTLQLKKGSFSLNGFYIATQDLIQWRPDISGTWSPNNIADVTQYGLEFETEFNKNFGAHQVQMKSIYAYTKAIDNQSNTQLIYVPLHKLTATIAYHYKKWSSFFQGLHNGNVYTTTDNSQDLSDYLVLNAGLTYKLPDKYGIQTQLQLVANNVTNTNYQNVAFRPMPNRNVNLNINFKF